MNIPIYIAVLSWLLCICIGLIIYEPLKIQVHRLIDWLQGEPMTDKEKELANEIYPEEYQ